MYKVFYILMILIVTLTGRNHIKKKIVPADPLSSRLFFTLLNSFFSCLLTFDFFLWVTLSSLSLFLFLLSTHDSDSGRRTTPTPLTHRPCTHLPTFDPASVIMTETLAKPTDASHAAGCTPRLLVVNSALGSKS
jgi:hypothetical protein